MGTRLNNVRVVSGDKVIYVSPGKIVDVEDHFKIRNAYYNERSLYCGVTSDKKLLISSDISEFQKTHAYDKDNLAFLMSNADHVTPLTGYKGVYELLPGTMLDFEFGQLSGLQVDIVTPNTLHTAEHGIDKITQVLDTIPKEPCISMLISGGRDSCLLAFVFRKVMGYPVKAVHVYDSRKAITNDTRIAQSFTKSQGIPLKLVDISQYVDKFGTTPRIVRHSIPNMGSFFPSMSRDIVEHFGSEHVWTGQGGDQIFGEVQTKWPLNIIGPSAAAFSAYEKSWHSLFSEDDIGTRNEYGPMYSRANSFMSADHEFKLLEDVYCPFDNISESLPTGDACRYYNMLFARKTHNGLNNAHYLHEVTPFTHPELIKFFATGYQTQSITEGLPRAFQVEMMRKLGIEDEHINCVKDFINRDAVRFATNECKSNILSFLQGSILSEFGLLDLDKLETDFQFSNKDQFDRLGLWDLLRVEYYLQNSQFSPDSVSETDKQY